MRARTHARTHPRTCDTNVELRAAPEGVAATLDHISPFVTAHELRFRGGWRTQVTHRTLEGDSFDYYMLFLV